MKKDVEKKPENSVVHGEIFEVFSADNPKNILALIYDATTNTMTQEGYTLWVQLEEDWVRVSSAGLTIRPSKKRAATEEQFKEMADTWIIKSKLSRARVVRHTRQSPTIYSLDGDILDSDELASIPSPIFETGAVKMAVPVGGWRASKITAKE